MLLPSVRLVYLHTPYIPRSFTTKLPTKTKANEPSLIKDPTLTSLYTNRAMARLNLTPPSYESSISDCDTALLHDKSSIKAHYYKSKCLLALRDVDTACEEARLAYESCRASDDKSLDMTMAHYLQCKTARWEVREKRRKREHADLEREVMGILEAETGREMEGADEGVRSDIENEGRARLARMKEIFERARKEDDRAREPPEWLVDDISFNVMVDPVMTHTGRSYERASIQAAINNNAIDPVTREPLAKGELIPNIGLKRACEWYLENNGWAYDW